MIPEAKPIESLPSASEVGFRLATPDDFETIAGLGRAFHEASGYASICEYDEQSMLLSLDAIHTASGFVVLAEADRRIAGFGAAILRPLFFDLSCIVASELFWWVMPRWRRHSAGVGLNLLASMETEAKRRGASHFQMAAIESLRGRAVSRMLERRGYRHIESAFTKRLHTEH